jgi:hypothetical protein
MLQLPKSKDGVPYISYSQYKSWNTAKSFSLRIEGKLEYMLGYFFGREFPDVGWAQFGTEVEGYICEREYADKFTEMEKAVLDSIIPLGVFQQEFMLKFDGFSLLGYLDDATEDFKHIRDFKTCSKNSSKQYYEEGYYQLDIYAMWVKQEFGYFPDRMEVLMIEREGNAFRGGRDMLEVGMQHWSHFRHTTPERQEFLRNDITRVAHEIADAWAVYQKMLKL